MEDQPDDSVLLKPKPKRIKTPAQQAVWDKACALRIANAKLKKDALSNAKAEIENKKKKVAPTIDPLIDTVPEIKQKVKTETPPAPLAKKKPKVVYESDSESEPEVIVVKKKKKKQQVIYEEESSEDDTPPPPPMRKAKPAPVVAVAPPPVRIPIVRFF
jgi:hypothetical protein